MEKYAITISRGFGSGGRHIGWMLADKLGINFYDKEIISMASAESGIREELFYKADEKISIKAKLAAVGLPKFSGNLITPDKGDFVSDENLFNYQAMIIKKLAERESCVFIGRAADYVLKDFDRVLSVNVQGNIEDCVKREMGYEIIKYDEAVKKVIRMNKERSDFYLYYTGRRWDDELNYDITLNSSKLSKEQCVNTIIALAEQKFGDLKGI